MPALNFVGCHKLICAVFTANKIFVDPIFLIKLGNVLHYQYKFLDNFQVYWSTKHNMKAKSGRQGTTGYF